mgnify:CR=1 FL=1
MPKDSKKSKKVKRKDEKRVAKKRRKNVKRVARKVKQRGGNVPLFHDPIHWDSMHTPSTSGSFGNFVGNIFGLVESSVNAVVDTVNLITEAVRVPGDLGKAFEGPSDPNIYNVNNI